MGSGYYLSVIYFSVFIFLSVCLLELVGANSTTATSGNCTGTGAGKRSSMKDWMKVDPDDFLKLQLNQRSLRGARWTLEQRKAGKVVDVYHSIDVMDATLINNNELTLRVEFNLRQTWVAEGLEFPKGLFKEDDPPNAFVIGSEQSLRDMWSPGSYISTSRESNMNTMGTPLNLVYIYKNTSIIFKVRMFTKVACSSSFQWYPLDIQSCDLTIESYKYHDDIVRYHWTDENLYRPVVIQMQRLFQYELRTPLKYYSGTVTRGGRGKKYSYIRLLFRFERKLGNNIIQVYTPTVLVVVLSWFSFWLGLDAIPGRISLLVTCMLTLVTMHSGMKTSIPPVHYITMMDVWYVCCMGFVFSAMCEFVAVKYIHWRHEQKVKAKETKYRKETRAKLHDLFQQHSGAGSKGKDIIKVTPKDGNGIVDRQKAFMSDLGQFNMVGGRLGSGSNDLLQSIIVGGMGMGNVGGEFGGMDEEDEERGDNGEGYDQGKGLPMWVKIDKVSRGFLPFLFCIFNGIYWPVLYNGSDMQAT